MATPSSRAGTASPTRAWRWASRARSTAATTWEVDSLGGFEILSDPAIAAGGGGRWYYSYIARGGVAGSDLDIFVQRSVDDGETWLPPVAVTADANFDDKSYVAARGDEVLVAYADFGTSPAKIHAARSINGGVSFDHDTVLANNSVGGNGACPVIAPDGTFYVFWRDSFQQFLWMSRSDDQGETWSPDESIVAMDPLPSTVPAPQGGYRLLNLPSAAVGSGRRPRRGLERRAARRRRHPRHPLRGRRQTPGASRCGSTTTPPGRCSSSPGSRSTSSASCTWSGTTGRNDDVDLDVYYAMSTDGGQSFRPNRRITAASFVPILPTEAGAAAFIGDYNGIAAGASGVYPFYQDSRRGEQDVWVTRLPAPLFLDDFESGDTGAWSHVEP